VSHKWNIRRKASIHAGFKVFFRIENNKKFSNESKQKKKEKKKREKKIKIKLKKKGNY